ncbi:MAG: abhydrolase domain-containing 18 [Vicinamibacteria bacterium]|nr:abhydrolase domain-containing 18 [Vicinamibacteria bacterium]
MLSLFFHRWERRLADVSKDRIVRPFDWGLDWLPTSGNGHHAEPQARVQAYVDDVLRDTQAWFTPPPTTDYDVVPAAADGSSLVRFPSALTTPHPENNRVTTRYFPAAAARGGARRAVLVLPQWNADEEGHVGLCRLIARFGMSALRLSLPYHDTRMPPELTRADYMVSANIVRTLEVCRQAVLDGRRAIAWLAHQGYDRIGILGTSLGSCLSMLTACHEPLIRAQALNHISPYFGDVVWRGLSTRHVRKGLDGQVSLQDLRALWLPISPQVHLDTLRTRDVKTLLVYASYDLTFPVDLSRNLVNEFRARGIPHRVSVLPCGHYSTGVAPFKFMDGAVLTRFLHASL